MNAGLSESSPTMPAVLAASLAKFGHRPAIVEGDTRLTWNDVAEMREQAARALIAIGARHGDRIAIWAPNIHEWIIAGMAIQSIGAVLVPINTRFKGREAADVLIRSRARYLLTVDEFLGIRFCDLLEDAQLPDLQKVILLRGQGGLSWAEFIDTGRSVSTDELRQYERRVSSDDIADIMFTSGTTGKPKGAIHTHTSNIAGIQTFNSILGLTEHDRYVIVPPFFHNFGYKSGWWLSALAGACIYPMATFDLHKLVSLVQLNG